MGFTRCWNCAQAATQTLTRTGSITLNACDNCTRIDRAEAQSRGWTITPLTETIPAPTHFTAWLVNDPSALDTDTCDITVIQDEAISHETDDEGNEKPVWASNGPQVFHAVTTVNAEDGDIDDAQDEAKDLMGAAGWQIVGDWESTDNAYIVTVERA